MAGSKDKAYDLLIVLDATASMGTFIQALNKALPEIISLSALTGCFERIGVVTYRDYCGGELTEWSGWCSPSGAEAGRDIVSQDHVLKMAGSIRAKYGGDWPEATRTGLARAYQEMRSDATTIILLYTDAPPHSSAVGGSNYNLEKTALRRGKYGQDSHLFVDWTSAARTFKSGPKHGVVFSVVSSGLSCAWSPYLYLSTVTGGTFFNAQRITADSISQLTLGVLLTWMGAENAVGEDQKYLADFKRYRHTGDLQQISKEDSKRLERYYTTQNTPKDDKQALDNIESLGVAVKDLPTLITARGPSVHNFAKRYVDDEGYKKLAVEQLQRIIASNVSSVSVNPIFGTLWRTVCNDRANEARNGLITMFGLEVDRISDANEKARMKIWLEESYNYAFQIQDLIAAVPEEERFPMVFLDPTEEFTTVAAENDDSDDRRLNEFTRAELLEIGRSCDYRILRRLGKVLTRLTYVEKKEDLPAHIKNASADDVPQIPMAMADPKHKRMFWKILLHAVLPGTMVTARPGAVLAALALRMGILPLRDVADQELLGARKKWNTIDIPETWNVGCLSLLLDADSDYETRVTEGTTVRATPKSSILKTEDRKLFKTLVDYKMLEMNLKTTLQAKISWKPEKAKVALGPVVICRQCNFPRSVTIMGSGGICGLCAAETEDCKCLVCSPVEDHAERLQTNVSKDHSETSTGSWVECSRIDCRGQYVVYNPDTLRVRAKCFYCRHGHGKSAMFGQAPLVECHKCLSRVIWPEEYRPKNLDLAAFECSACASNIVTIITHDTSAQELTEENGNDWLLRNDEKAIKAPFNGRSLFYTASQCDLEKLPGKVEILPASESKLTIAGKLVRNSPEIKESLQHWVLSRRTEAGVCSLCFSNVRKDNLRRACGRAGCHQLICNGCTKDWYGLNARGRLINVAALSCPFCRRQPVPKTIATFGLVHMGNLRTAVEEAGSWIYAWCATCGFAKQYVERACAAGAPPELNNWSCDECKVDEGQEVAKSRECPGCGVVTEKMGGCDHITCPCGTHWCYACGKDVGAEKIYEHIGLEHGGLWGGDDEDYEYDEYDEDD